MPSRRKRIFVSVANCEHAALRVCVRDLLTRAGFDVVVQPDFPHTVADTVRKLDALIAPCDLVVHIVGRDPGSRAAPEAVADFFAHTAPTAFLTHLPAVQARLGDCAALTYVQWEPWLALHRKIDVLVYGVTGHGADDFPQRGHLDALYLARKHADTLPDDTACARVVADVCVHFGVVPGDQVKIAPSRLLRHAPDRLFGREDWLTTLDDAWADDAVNVLALVAWGGVGKTALVAHWVATRFHTKKWPGVERYFDWSFYSQGSGESRQSSADLFIQEALTFFDDPDPLKGSAWERGERLAGLVRNHRTLLVLDGVEPLQYPPNDGQAGRFKDPALEALLQGLAADNRGLCVVTTREHLANVESQPAVREKKLDTLLRDAAVSLLRHLQLVGTEEEMTAAWAASDGHALTLRLLGRLIARAYGKDVTKWREVKFEEADKLAQGRSAMRVMRKYEAWLQSATAATQLELAVLRLTGLFDRPMSPDCFRALCAAPAIPGLTEQLVAAKPSELEAALTTLVENDLLTHGGVVVAGVAYRHADLPIDAHPLIREYFALQLRKEQPEAFKAAHSLLFDHLCETTKPDQPDTWEGLQLLYQATVHGCQAGLYEKVWKVIFNERIRRGVAHYSTNKLGAFGADLSVAAGFINDPSDTFKPKSALGGSASLKEGVPVELQHEVFYCAAESLRAQTRLHESMVAAKIALGSAKASHNSRAAAEIARFLSALSLSQGGLNDALDYSNQAVFHAKQSGFQQEILTALVTRGFTSYQLNGTIDNLSDFDEAANLLNSPGDALGQRKAELELWYAWRRRECECAQIEVAAWRVYLTPDGSLTKDTIPELNISLSRRDASKPASANGAGTAEQAGPLYLSFALLTRARAKLFCRLLDNDPVYMLDAEQLMNAAVKGFRAGGRKDYLPLVLLPRAWMRRMNEKNHDAAGDLDEAQQIAERGPMPLHLADVHLHRARMFRDTGELAKAAKLIRELGYGRRYDELADAEAALA